MQRIPPPIDPGDSRPTTAPCVAAGLTHNSSCSPSQLHSAVRTYKCQIHPGSLLPVMHTFPETSQNQRLPLRCISVVVWGIGVVARHHRSGSAFGGIVLFYFFFAVVRAHSRSIPCWLGLWVWRAANIYQNRSISLRWRLCEWQALAGAHDTVVHVY